MVLVLDPMLPDLLVTVNAYRLSAVFKNIKPPEGGFMFLW